MKKYIINYVPQEGKIREGELVYEGLLSKENVYMVFKRDNKLVFYRGFEGAIDVEGSEVKKRFYISA